MATAPTQSSSIRLLIEAAKIAVMDAQDGCSDERIAAYLREAFGFLDDAWTVARRAERR